VTATDGQPGKPDSLSRSNDDGSLEIPEESKIVLRYTNAIDAKYGRYLKYREKNIIAENDPYIVAINGHSLSDGWAAYGEMPRVLKAVFPIGVLQVVLDKNTTRIMGSRHQFRPEIVKTSGCSVSTEIFIDRKYSGISAILHSCANVGMSSRPLGVDFLLVHNPLAARPVTQQLLDTDREYWVELENGVQELVCRQRT
jgi:type I restriction enzyme S subunit